MSKIDGRTVRWKNEKITLGRTLRISDFVLVNSFLVLSFTVLGSFFSSFVTWKREGGREKPLVHCFIRCCLIKDEIYAFVNKNKEKEIR